MVVNEELTGPHFFAEALGALVDGRGPVAVVHESQAHEEEPPWVVLQYQPLWRQPLIASWWRVAVLTLALLGGYVLWDLATPRAWPRPGGWLFLAVLAGFVVDTFTSAFSRLRQALGVGLRRRREAAGAKADLDLLASEAGEGPAAVETSALLPAPASGSLLGWTANPQQARRPAAKTPPRRWMPAGACLALLLSGLSLWQVPAARLALSTQGSALLARVSHWWAGSPREIAESPLPPAAVEAPAMLATGGEEVDAAPPAGETPLPPAPTAEAPLDFARVLAEKRHLPPTVALAQPLTFPALVQGRVAGQISLPRGTECRLVAVRDEKLVLEYRGATQAVAVEATDLLERVRAVTLAAAAPVPLPPPVSAPPTARTAPPTRNAIAAAGPSSAEEIPGLPPQPAAYFRNLPPRP